MELVRVAVGVAVAVVLLRSSAAEACTSCTVDSECPKNFGCEQAAPGVGFCSSKDCATDSDCAAGMRCVLAVATECDSGNTNCHSVNACAPKWAAGCSVDADCGDAAFTCVIEGNLCRDGQCTPMGQCMAKTSVPCSSDSECATGWTCTDDPGGGCINSGGPACGANGCPAPPPRPKVCEPPYWGLTSDYLGPGPGGTSVPDTSGREAAAGPDAGQSSQLAGSPASSATPSVSQAQTPASSPASESGCSATGEAASGTWMWLIGAAGIVATRRRARASK